MDFLTARLSYFLNLRDDFCQTYFVCRKLYPNTHTESFSASSMIISLTPSCTVNPSTTLTFININGNTVSSVAVESPSISPSFSDSIELYGPESVGECMDFMVFASIQGGIGVRPVHSIVWTSEELEDDTADCQDEYACTFAVWLSVFFCVGEGVSL